MPSVFDRFRAFAADLETGQFAPNAKWLREMLTGIFLSKSLMLSKIGRAADGRSRSDDPNWMHVIEKRLSRNLLSERFNEQAFMSAYWPLVERRTRADEGEGVVIGVDYTDAQKPFAQPDHPKGMQYACRCRDGSKKEKGLGYPIAMFTASLPNGQYMPVLAHVYSYDDPAFMGSSEPKVFMQCMSEVAPHVGRRAWWAMDRGYENHRYFAHLDALERRWVTRVRVSDRVQHPQTVFTESGEKTDVRALSRARGAGSRTRVTRKVNGRSVVHELERFTVYLSDQKTSPRAVGQRRTLLVARRLRQGKAAKETLTMIASEWVGTDEHAEEIFGVYVRRWKVEEATRAAKDSRGWGVRLEDFRSLKFDGIRRLVMLAQAVYLFISEMYPRIAERSFAPFLLGVGRLSSPEDWTYQLMVAIGNALASVARCSRLRWMRARLGPGP